jgi:hypothetical protein
MATRGCRGTPRLDGSMWKCSACRKRWEIERVEPSRGEIGGRVVGGLRDAAGTRKRKLGRAARLRGSARSSRAETGLASSRAAWALGDVGAVLDHVAEEMPHAFATWRLHVLDDAALRAGRATALGLVLDAVPGRIAELIRVGLLAQVEHELTLYRVRKWIGEARRRTVELYQGRLLGMRAARGDEACRASKATARS